MHLVFLGPPACGKGTQSAALVKKYGYYHLSTGDLMRKEIATDSALGKMLKKNIETGVLAASEIVNELLKKDIENNRQKSILFDGYPRKVDQAEYLDAVLKENKSTLKQVFYFDIDAEELFQRILSRITCKACGAVYNLQTNPPKEDGVCDSCGSLDLVKRGDDNEEILKNRIKSFYEETAPLREFYQKRGILTVIDARAPVEIVTEQIVNAL
jgi:adenylate kinase